MAFQFCSFASGSSGNCYLVKSDDTVLLIDVGITGKKIMEGLDAQNLSPEQIDGILITHEHTDHVKSLKMMSKKAPRARIYSSAGTLAQIMDKIEGDRARAVGSGERFAVGDISVITFRLSHDAAEPVGFSLMHGGRQVTIVTDTGCISEEMFRHMVKANLLVLEANHEVNILKMSSYPYHLKRRILGEEGHLSNETAGECLCRILKMRQSQSQGVSPDVPSVLLAHLSRENNTPSQAYLTIRNILFEEDFYIDKDLNLDVAPRDEVGICMEV